MSRDPWDQLEDETDAQYLRFLVFRNMGWNRTIRGAYRYAHQKVAPRETAEWRKQSLVISSNVWYHDSSKHDWQNRATAWDIWRLQKYGNNSVVGYVRGMANLIRKWEKAVEDHKPGDPEWGDVLKTLALIAPRFDMILQKAAVPGVAAGPTDAPGPADTDVQSRAAIAAGHQPDPPTINGRQVEPDDGVT